MKITEALAKWFADAEPDAAGIIKIPSSPPLSTESKLSIEEFAVFSVIDLLSSAAAMCEWRTYRGNARTQGQTWYQMNLAPNPNQSGTVFKRLLFARLLRFNEALVFEHRGGWYLADSWTRECNGFNPAVYWNIQHNSTTLPGPIPEADVFYFRLAYCGQRAQLLSGLNGLYSAAMTEAWDKYRKSGGRRGILSISATEQGSPNFQQNLETLMNDRFKRFFENKNAVLPLTSGYTYTPQNGSDMQKTTSEVSDLGNLLTQAQTSACNVYHLPPSILRGEVTNLDDAINEMLTFGLKPPIVTVENEVNRKLYKQATMNGDLMRISTLGIKHTDVLSRADKIEKLLQNRIYSPNGIREMVGDEPIMEPWADEYAITKNAEIVNTEEAGV